MVLIVRQSSVSCTLVKEKEKYKQIQKAHDKNELVLGNKKRKSKKKVKSWLGELKRLRFAKSMNETHRNPIAN